MRRPEGSPHAWLLQEGPSPTSKSRIESVLDGIHKPTLQTRPLSETEDTPKTGARRRGLVGGHDVHHPAPESVRLDPVDREAVQVQQTRRVRH
jgi:hypothetical protein